MECHHAHAVGRRRAAVGQRIPFLAAAECTAGDFERITGGLRLGCRVGDSAVRTILFLFGANALSPTDRKSTRLNSSHLGISYAVFCLKKKKKKTDKT